MDADYARMNALLFGVLQSAATDLRADDAASYDALLESCRVLLRSHDSPAEFKVALVATTAARLLADAYETVGLDLETELLTAEARLLADGDEPVE